LFLTAIRSPDGLAIADRSCFPPRSILRAAGQRNVNRVPLAHPVADEAKLAVIKAPDELVRGLHHKLITVFD
jgi:hypothetical protein